MPKTEPTEDKKDRKPKEERSTRPLDPLIVAKRELADAKKERDRFQKYVARYEEAEAKVAAKSGALKQLLEAELSAA